jgi:predicted  nucleic acid-binding Zn-ribbon protein
MSRTCFRCGIRFRDSERTLWCPATDCGETGSHERPPRYDGAGAAHPRRDIFTTVHFQDWEAYEQWLEKKGIRPPRV